MTEGEPIRDDAGRPGSKAHGDLRAVIGHFLEK